MLVVMSRHEMALSKAAQRRIWGQFMRGGTNHSANASTLPYIIRRCELEQQAYKLEAMPGVGYFISPLNEKPLR